MEAPQELVRCGRCKVSRTADKFGFRRQNILYKTCVKCRTTDRAAEIARRARRVVPPPVIAVEMHNCARHQKMCEYTVKNGKRFKTCDEYRTANHCQHNCPLITCIPCRGAGICEHLRVRRQCIECGGTSICVHDLQTPQCKLCSDPKTVTIKKMIANSRTTDKLLGLFTRDILDDYITYEHIENLMELNDMCCVYCYMPMNTNDRNPLLVTIERIDNGIGHTRANTTLCCNRCNVGKVGDKPAGVAARNEFWRQLDEEAAEQRRWHEEATAAESEEETKEEEYQAEEKTN